MKLITKLVVCAPFVVACATDDDVIADSERLQPSTLAPGEGGTTADDSPQGADDAPLGNDNAQGGIAGVGGRGTNLGPEPSGSAGEGSSTGGSGSDDSPEPSGNGGNSPTAGNGAGGGDNPGTAGSGSGGTPGAGGAPSMGGSAGNGGTAGNTGVAGDGGGFSGYSCSPVSASNGYVECEGGWSHRQSVEECPSLLPRADFTCSEGQGCQSDADCTDAPHGECFQAPLAPVCSCRYGCVSDADCDAGEICVCGSVVGQCMPADCTSDADCAPGVLCGSYGATLCGATGGFACQHSDDQCLSNQECENFNNCVLNEGIRQCLPCATP